MLWKSQRNQKRGGATQGALLVRSPNSIIRVSFGPNNKDPGFHFVPKPSSTINRVSLCSKWRFYGKLKWCTGRLLNVGVLYYIIEKIKLQDKAQCPWLLTKTGLPISQTNATHILYHGCGVVALSEFSCLTECVWAHLTAALNCGLCFCTFSPYMHHTAATECETKAHRRSWTWKPLCQAGSITDLCGGLLLKRGRCVDTSFVRVTRSSYPLSAHRSRANSVLSVGKHHPLFPPCMF